MADPGLVIPGNRRVLVLNHISCFDFGFPRLGLFTKQDSERLVIPIKTTPEPASSYP